MTVREEEDAASLTVGWTKVIHDDARVLRYTPAEHTHPLDFHLNRKPPANH